MCAILRPARTPKGTEVRTVVKHVTQRLEKHCPRTRLVWRGDSHYGRNEVMAWCEDNGEAFIFGLPGNSVLDAMVEETCDHLRFWHAIGTEEKLRCYTNLEYKARSWTRARRVIARIECSRQSDPQEPGTHPHPATDELSRRRAVPRRCTRLVAIGPLGGGVVAPSSRPARQIHPQRVAP